MSDSDLDELMECPAAFTFRAVAETRPGLKQACADTVERALERPVQSVSAQPSSQGKWTSVRITAEVLSAEEVLSAYTALKALDGVRMTL